MVLGGACALSVGDVHLEFDGLLEDGGSSRGLVLCPEAGLGHDAVAQTGNLPETDRERWVNFNWVSNGNE